MPESPFVCDVSDLRPLSGEPLQILASPVQSERLHQSAGQGRWSAMIPIPSGVQVWLATGLVSRKLAIVRIVSPAEASLSHKELEEQLS
jgi:hypothetical protein